MKRKRAFVTEAELLTRAREEKEILVNEMKNYIQYYYGIIEKLRIDEAELSAIEINDVSLWSRLTDVTSLYWEKRFIWNNTQYKHGTVPWYKADP